MSRWILGLIAFAVVVAVAFALMNRSDRSPRFERTRDEAVARLPGIQRAHRIKRGVLADVRAALATPVVASAATRPVPAGALSGLVLLGRRRDSVERAVRWSFALSSNPTYGGRLYPELRTMLVEAMPPAFEFDEATMRAVHREPDRRPALAVVYVPADAPPLVRTTFADPGWPAATDVVSPIAYGIVQLTWTQKQVGVYQDGMPANAVLLTAAFFRVADAAALGTHQLEYEPPMVKPVDREEDLVPRALAELGRWLEAEHGYGPPITAPFPEAR